MQKLKLYRDWIYLSSGEWAQAAQNVDAGNDNADGGAAPQPEP